MPVLVTLMVAKLVAAIAYVVVALLADGVPAFWLWFGLVTILTSFNSASTPLLQTLSLAPMGAIAGTASSITGAVIFVGGGLLGSIIDGFITTTVTAFGVGFAVYTAIGLIAIAGARSSTSSYKSQTA